MAATKTTARNDEATIEVRGRKVLFDDDVASLYGVTRQRLNAQVTRNIERFPEEFAFRLTHEEFHRLKFDHPTTAWARRRTPPRAFTEQGIAMLASVLRSHRAAEVSVEIVRTFVHVRHALAHEHSGRSFEDVEHDAEMKAVLDAIRKLMALE